MAYTKDKTPKKTGGHRQLSPVVEGFVESKARVFFALLYIQIATCLVFLFFLGKE